MIKSKLTSLGILLVILFFLPGLTKGKSLVDPPVLADPPQRIITPDELDYSGYGYVKVIVYKDDGIVIPYCGAGVFLLNLHYEVIDYKLTDGYGETEFLAPAGKYILRAHIDLDARDRTIELPANGSAESVYILFSYNPTIEELEGSDISEPVCPGLIVVTVMQNEEGYNSLVPHMEVQLVK